MIRKIIKIQQSHAINVSYKQVEDLRIVHIKKVIIRLPLGLEIHRMQKNNLFNSDFSTPMSLCTSHINQSSLHQTALV